MEDPQCALTRKEFLTELKQILLEQQQLLENERLAAEERARISEKLFGKEGLAYQIDQLPDRDPRKPALQLQLITAGVQLVAGTRYSMEISSPISTEKGASR